MMPDIKTEMSKVLNAWEKDAQETTAKPAAPAKPVVSTPSGKKLWTPTNNVTRATFDYVQNNSGQTGEQIRAALGAKGFNLNSVSSLLTQFTKQGLIVRDVGGKHYAKVSEYRPLSSTKKYKATGKRKSKIVTAPRTPRAPRSAGIAALKPEPRVETATTINISSAQPLKNPAPYVAMAWDAETVINNIGLKQAHALYKELSTYFGG